MVYKRLFDNGGQPASSIDTSKIDTTQNTVNTGYKRLFDNGGQLLSAPKTQQPKIEQPAIKTTPTSSEPIVINSPQEKGIIQKASEYVKTALPKAAISAVSPVIKMITDIVKKPLEEYTSNKKPALQATVTPEGLKTIQEGNKKYTETNNQIVQSIKAGSNGDAGFLGTFVNSFIPLKAVQTLNDGVGSDFSKLRQQALTEYGQENPIKATISEGIGMIANLMLGTKMGTGFGLNQKVETVAGGARSFAPTLTRIVGHAAEGASTFGIIGTLKEAFDEIQKGDVSPTKIVKTGLEQAATGGLISVAGALPTAVGRTSAGAGIFGGLTTVETLIQNKKLTAEDFVNIGVNALIGGIFEAIGGSGKTGAFKDKEMQNMSEDLMIGRIISNNPKITREEAQKAVITMESLGKTAASQLNETQQTRIVQILEKLPDSFQSAKPEVKAKFVDEVTNNIIKKDQTIEQAVNSAILTLTPGITVPTTPEIEQKRAVTEVLPVKTGKQPVNQEITVIRDNLIANKANPFVNADLAGEQQAKLDNYQNENATPVIQIKDTDQHILAQIKTVKYPDGQWGYSFDIDTPENGIFSGFSSNPLSKTKIDAVNEAKTAVLDYAKNEIQNVSEESKTAFNNIILHVSAVEPKLNVPVEVRKTIVSNEINKNSFTETKNVLQSLYENNKNLWQMSQTTESEKSALLQKLSRELYAYMAKNALLKSGTKIENDLSQLFKRAFETGKIDEMSLQKMWEESTNAPPELQKTEKSEVVLPETSFEKTSTKSQKEKVAEVIKEEPKTTKQIAEEKIKEKLPTDEIEMVNYLEKKYPNGITLYHQTNKSAIQKIMKEGFKGDENNDVYFNVEKYDKSRSTSGGNEEVIKIVLKTEDYGDILPDRGSYDGSDQEMIKQMFKFGFEGADITLTDNVANKYLTITDNKPRFAKVAVKRFGLMDDHPTYTPEMRKLIADALETDDTFPYTKMTKEQRGIVDAAWKDTLSKIPITMPKDFKPYVRTITGDTVDIKRLSDPAYFVEAYQSTFARDAGGTDEKLYKILTKELVPEDREASGYLANYYEEALKKATSVKKQPRFVKKQAEVVSQAKITLAPSKVMDEEQLKAELKKVYGENVPYTVTKTEKGTEVYTRPFVGKSELKMLLKNNDEFKADPYLVVNTDKNLEFVGKTSKFIVKPEAMQINAEKLNVGDKIFVDEKALSEKGVQQTRIYNEDEEAYGLEEQDEGVAFQSKWAVQMAAEPITKETINKTNIMNWVEKTFNIPIRGKVTNKWKASGMYYPQKWLIRLKKWGELPVIVHEVAHHIDLTTLKEQYPDGWRHGSQAMTTELANLDYDQKKRRTKEGFAEYLRYKMTTDEAPQRAPIFNKFFEEFLKTNPKLKTQLDELKRQLAIWFGQGAENRMIQHIDWKGEHTDVPGIGNKVKRAVQFIQEKFNDEFYIPKKITSEIEKIIGRDLRPTQNPAKMLEYSKSKAGAIARTFVMEKAIDEYGNVVGPGLAEILKPIKRSEIKQFIAYAVSKRALNLEGRKIESGFALEDIQFMLDKYQSEEWDKVATELTQWSNHLLDWVIRAGGLDTEAAKIMRDLNPIYLPFKRAFLDQIQVMKQGVGGYVDTGSGLKRIKGSGRAIINPIEVMMTQATQMIAKAQKIKAASLFTDLAVEKGLGGFITEVPAPMVATKFDASQIEDYIATLTGELDTGGLEGQSLTVFTQGNKYAGKENIVTTFKDGKLKFYEIHPDLYNAFKAVDPLKLGPIGKVLAPFSRLLRLGATELKVSFGIARNPFRDALSYVVFSKRNAVTILDPIKGIYTNLTTKPTEPTWRFKKLGGALSGQIGLDRASTKTAYDELLLGNLDKIGKGLLVVKHPVDTLRDLISVTEMGPRSIELEKNYELYRSPAWKDKHPDWTDEDAFVQAFLDAQDVTVNFTKSGKWARQLNEITAFFNVAIRGPEKMFRTFKERPVATTIKSILWLTTIAMVTWYRNKDKEWYKNLEPSYKYNNLFFEVGDNIIRLPVPFELGTIFMAVPQAVMDTYKNKDTEAMKGVLSILNSQIPNPMPSAFGPMLDIATNKNYLGSPIESGGMKYKYPTERYYDYTSSLAKNLSKLIDKTGAELSPIQIDYLIDAYSGGFLKQFRMSGSELYNLPVLSDLMLRDPLYPKRQLNNFFNDYTKLGQKIQSEKENENSRGIYNAIASDDEINRYEELKDFYNVYQNIQVDVVAAKADKDTAGRDLYYKEITDELKSFGYD